VAFEVPYATGLRRGDADRVGRPHLRDGVIRITTEKTGERVAVAGRAGPCGELTLIAGERGAPVAKESFGNMFRDRCNAAGLNGKGAHGVRKSAATADQLSGFPEAELDAK
jgi:hypothetical protein